jgi:hypothetical protein
MSYKARSFKIQEVLKKMHETFSMNLDQAKQKEAASQAQYEKLTASKNEQLAASRDSLTKMEVENGAKGMSTEDAQEEVDALKEQVKNDTKFIAETTQSLIDKKESWKVRSELRAGELAAINKAIYILHNDDARDLFKKSFASQGFFLQVAQSSGKALQHRTQKAAAAIRAAAERSGDKRLLSLAAVLRAPEGSVKVNFEPVIESINKMVALLQEEEAKDLEIKEQCERDRMDNTRAAIIDSRDIDNFTDMINQLTAKIEECQKKIEELLAAHKKVEEDLAKATRMRADEHAAWLVTDKEDKDAAETVMSAKQVLEGFYQENFALVQKQPVTGMKAGEAPPPPPPTWEGGYGGQQGEAMGIVAIMDMVKEDIIKDRADAKADEDKSQAEYDAFKMDSENHMMSLMAE